MVSVARGEGMKIQLTATFIFEGCKNPEHAKELLNVDLESIAFPCYSASYVNNESVILEL